MASDSEDSGSSFGLRFFPHHMQALGHAIAAWAGFERRMAVLSNVLFGDSDSAQVVMTAVTSLQARLKILRVISRTKASGPLLDGLEKLLTRIESLGQQRNDYAHSPWVVDSNSGDLRLLRQPSKSGNQRPATVVTVEDLEQFASDVSSLETEVFYASMMLQAHLDPSHAVADTLHALRAFDEKGDALCKGYE